MLTLSSIPGCNGGIPSVYPCQHCKFYYCPAGFDLCTKCNIMKVSQPSRFGKLKQSFGDFGELRQQKKEPKLEVFYIPVKVDPKFPLSGSETSKQVEVLRSVNNCSSDQLNDFIRKTGKHLEAGNISQANAEIVLDHCYAELNRRLNP